MISRCKRKDRVEEDDGISKRDEKDPKTGKAKVAKRASMQLHE